MATLGLIPEAIHKYPQVSIIHPAMLSSHLSLLPVPLPSSRNCALQDYFGKY